MKKLYNLFLLIASFVLLLAACQQEEPYTPGEEDMAGCYGVYFPVQGAGTILDPAAPTVAAIQVARVNTAGAITVPYTLNDPSGVLVAGDIVFEDGQSETVLDISFDRAEVGVKYSCSFHITDPQYASKYNSQPSIFDFSILREKWNALGKCKYTDDIIPSTYNIPIQTWEVEIEESDSKKGLYRLKNVYGADSPFFEEGVEYKDNYMIVHAENPNKVYFETYQSDANLGYGNVIMVSIAGLHVQDGKLADAEPFYGTDKGGVITFPPNSLGMAEPGYDGGALYQANVHGAFKIVMPGVVEVDYSVSVAMDEYSAKGVTHAAIDLGRDVAQVKYAIYEGVLNSAQIDQRVGAIADGSEGNVKVVTESGIEEISLEKTGVYTIVAVSFSEDGTARQYDVQNFTFIAAGEDVPVIASCGLTTTDKNYPVDQGEDKFLEYYIYGEDLTEVKVCLFREADMVNNMGICIEILNLQKPVSAEVLAQINDKGYVSGFGNLPPDTEYTLLVSASNGYKKELFGDFEKTQGKLEIDINNCFGFYEGVYGTEDETGFILANTAFIMVPSDNAEKGNVMFPAFMGFNCTYPVYGTFDPAENHITIPTGQEMVYMEDDDLHLFVANLIPPFEGSITLDVLEDGHIGGVSEGIPALMLYEGTELLGLYDLMYSCDLILQEEEEEGAALNRILEQKTKTPLRTDTSVPQELRKKIAERRSASGISVQFRSSSLSKGKTGFVKRNDMIQIDR